MIFLDNHYHARAVESELMRITVRFCDGNFISRPPIKRCAVNGIPAKVGRGRLFLDQAMRTHAFDWPKARV